jgi:hypothetical protein
MRDLYAMNNETGEIIPCEQAIAEFYKTHKWNESWTDFYTVTDIEVENTFIAFPDFSKAITA